MQSDIDTPLQRSANASDVGVREKRACDPCPEEEQAMEEKLARGKQRDVEEDLQMLVRGAGNDPTPCLYHDHLAPAVA